MAKPKTKKEDALSVVKSVEIVEEVVQANGVEEKSVLVEMSDADTGNTDMVSDTSKLEVAVTIDIPVLVEESKTEKKEEESEDEDEEPMYKKSEIYEIVKSALAEVLPIAKGLEDVKPLPTESSPEITKSDLDVSVEELYTSIKSAVGNPTLSLEEKLQVVQPSLEKVGTSIITTVKSSVGQPNDTVSNGNADVLKAIKDLGITVRSEIEQVRNEVAVVKAQIPTAQTIQDNRVPVPRSVSPNLVSQALQVKAQNAPKPGSVAAIARRSVGLQD